ncbi:MAG: hypothetical protein C4547_06565 [Phycisphaerales bacterium]|nr:MAG: hypothetical protein C4547_06565 [Phycisphaerales bacterium]
MKIRHLLLTAAAAALCCASGASAQFVYMTSIDAGNSTFARYDVANNQWTQLTGIDTGAQMAVSTSGDLYAYRRGGGIQRYNPDDDSWTDVMVAPPGSSGSYGNLEITRDGEFLYTETNVRTLWYTDGGQWQTRPLPFGPNAMGDYDPTSHQYVVGEWTTGNAHMIKLSDFSVIDFTGSPGGNGERARHSVILDGRYYFQYSSLAIHYYDLSNPGAPAVAASAPYGAFYNSSAVDRGSGIIYDYDLRTPGNFRSFDPGTGQFTPLAAFNFAGNHSSIAFTGGAANCVYTLKKSKAKGGCDRCPPKGGDYRSEATCEDVKECAKKVKTTIACPGGGNGTCKLKGKRSSCG